MRLHEYLNVNALSDEIEAGYVTRREHPEDPAFEIYNYTKKAQAEQRWNDVTKKCRGLITQATPWGIEIIARPWQKFFNLGEHSEGGFNIDAPVWAVDKRDGSNGIMYLGPDGWAIATRGSFSSEQAIEGTKMLRERIAEGFLPRVGVTYLFEIIYPENRIVLDYGDKRELVLLDVLATGSTDRLASAQEAYVDACDWFERAEGHRSTLRKLLTDPPRENAEGWVAHTADGRMVKVKETAYVAKHRIVFGLSELRVWEALRDGRASELLGSLPEEFLPWFEEVANRIDNEAYSIYKSALDACDSRPWFEHRGDLAWWVRTNCSEPNLVFALIDGKDIWPSIWRRVRPAGGSKAHPTSTPERSAA